MVNVQSYREYWEQYLQRMPAIEAVVPMTVEEDISKKLQDITHGKMVLFMLVPEVKTSGLNVDNYDDHNEGVVILAKKYDPQRQSSFDCIEELQPVISQIRDYMLADMGQGCPVLGRIDVNSIKMIPVSTWYNVLAGWMIDFTFSV